MHDLLKKGLPQWNGFLFPWVKSLVPHCRLLNSTITLSCYSTSTMKWLSCKTLVVVFMHRYPIKLTHNSTLNFPSCFLKDSYVKGACFQFWRQTNREYFIEFTSKTNHQSNFQFVFPRSHWFLHFHSKCNYILLPKGNYQRY